jgi:hypothetical protein
LIIQNLPDHPVQGDVVRVIEKMNNHARQLPRTVAAAQRCRKTATTTGRGRTNLAWLGATAPGHPDAGP